MESRDFSHGYFKKLDWIIQNLEENQIAKATFENNEWFVVKVDGTIRYYRENEPKELITMSYSNLVADYEIVDRRVEKEFDDFEEFERAFSKGEKCVLKYKRVEEQNALGLRKVQLLEGKTVMFNKEHYDCYKNNMKRIKEYKIEITMVDNSKYYGCVVVSAEETYEMMLLKGLFELKETLKINKVKTENIIACNVEELV